MEKQKFQQGDVVLVRVCGVPPEAVASGSVVASGEVTGHSHRVVGGAVLETANMLFVCVKDGPPAQLLHEEHATILIPTGTWQVRRVREYDHFAEEARQVVD